MNFESNEGIKNGITQSHVKKLIEKCAKSHLDNPPQNLKIPVCIAIVFLNYLQLII